MLGEGDEKKVSVLAEQNISPFHKITIPHYDERLPRVDSPRAVAPKIKKSAARTTSTSSGDHVAPTRRGRRAKNTGKKNRTSDTSASTSPQMDTGGNIVTAADDDKICNGGISKLSSGSGTTGKNNLESGRMVGGKSDLLGRETVVNESSLQNKQKLSSKAYDAADDAAASDVEEKEADSESEGQTASANTHYANDAITVSDVDQKASSPVTAKGRRSTSLPAMQSRYSAM